MSNVTKLSTSTRPVPVTWVESLFARMTAMYGAKFADMWRGADVEQVKALWAEEMGKLSNEELKRGFGALMTRDWPPSLPEYIKLCKPAVDPMVAYYEAVSGVQARAKGEMGSWSHPAIFWAALPMAFDLGLQSFSQIKLRWERALAEQMEKSEWAAIPQPMVALPAPGKALLSKEKAGQMLEELGATAVVKNIADKTDYKRWAKNIMKNIKSKNHGIPDWIIKDAKKALGMAH